MNRSPRVGQAHKPGPFADGSDPTKLFHVKHFCPVGAQDLTRSKTATTPSICKIDRFSGTIRVGRRQRYRARRVLRRHFRCKVALVWHCLRLKPVWAKRTWRNGRRKGLKIPRLRSYGFDSRRPHQSSASAEQGMQLAPAFAFFKKIKGRRACALRRLLSDRRRPKRRKIAKAVCARHRRSTPDRA
jgi:hypothetical protein